MKLDDCRIAVILSGYTPSSPQPQPQNPEIAPGRRLQGRAELYRWTSVILVDVMARHRAEPTDPLYKQLMLNLDELLQRYQWELATTEVEISHIITDLLSQP